MIIIFILLLSFGVQAREKRPLWEYGFGAGYLDLPDYPTSSRRQFRNILLPFIRYRGETFRSDDEGTRAIFPSDSRWKLELSFGGSFPANSDGNPLRQGMADLDWTFELGPRIIYQLTDRNEKGQIRLQAARRFAWVTDGSFLNYQGARWATGIQAERRHIWGIQNLEINYWYNFIYLTEGLADYFFEVRNKDVTLERQRYNAQGGYLGNDQLLSISYLYKKLRVFAIISYNDYSKAVVRNSPLYENPYNVTTAFGLTYLFGASEQLEK